MSGWEVECPLPALCAGGGCMEGQNLTGMDQRLQMVPNLGAGFFLVPLFCCISGVLIFFLQ